MKSFLSIIIGSIMLLGCSKSSDNLNGQNFRLSTNNLITLSFEAEGNKFYGQASVNRYFGTYEVNGSQISFGPVGATMMAGPEDRMVAEYKYFAFLPNVKTFELTKNQLILTTDSGETLVYNQYTPEKETEAKADGKITVKPRVKIKQNNDKTGDIDTAKK